MNNTIWKTKFETEFYPLLNPVTTKKHKGIEHTLYQRGNGFKLMFELVLNQKQSNFKIIETGTLRNFGNWVDGQSAFIFTEFLKIVGGEFHSVDISEAAVASAKANISYDKSYINCSDSVEWLKEFPQLDTVDLFYLDSWDVVWANPTDSAAHHLKEFLVIEPYLKPGSVVAIDDNTFINGQRTGKGLDVYNYLKNKGKLPLYDDYQIIYQF